MKQFKGFFLALALTAALTGCWGGEDQPSSSAKPTATPSPQSSVTSMLPGSAPSGSAETSDSVSDSTLPPKPGHEAAYDSDSTSDSSMTSRAAAAAAAPAGSEWALRLVDQSHPLPFDFQPDTRPVHGNDQQQFDIRAADDLEALLFAAHQEGSPLQLDSAYRSAQQQADLFEDRVQQLTQQGMTRAEAEIEAQSQTPRAGRSEHQLGLAVDFSAQDGHLDEDFSTSSSFQWLEDRAQEYGFVLRYPKEGQAVTGVRHSPCHWRYVGRAAAAEIHAANTTLEEYRRQKGFIG